MTAGASVRDMPDLRRSDVHGICVDSRPLCAGSQVLEDARLAEEAAGGTEAAVVVVNDGSGDQDIELLMEMLEVRPSDRKRVPRARVSAPCSLSLGFRRIVAMRIQPPHSLLGTSPLAFSLSFQFLISLNQVLEFCSVCPRVLLTTHSSLRSFQPPASILLMDFAPKTSSCLCLCNPR
eukprot:2512221-Pleurochrysis_carterae.AAC.1